MTDTANILKEILPTIEKPAEKLFNQKYYRTVNIDVAFEEKQQAAKLAKAQKAKTIDEVDDKVRLAMKSLGLANAEPVNQATSEEEDENTAQLPPVAKSQEDYNIILKGFGFKMD